MSTVKFNRAGPLAEQPADDAPGPSGADLGASLARLAGLAARVLEAPWAAIVAERQHGASGGDPPGRAAAWLSGPFSFVHQQSVVFTGEADSAEFLQTWPDLGFQATAPLLDDKGRAIGVLRVADVRPHPPPTSDQRRSLADIAALAAAAIHNDAQIADLREVSARERVQAEIALGAVGMGAFDWDVESGRVAYNDRLLDILGVTRVEVAGWGYEDFFTCIHPDDRDALRQSMDTELRRLGIYHHDCRVIRPADGQTIWMSTAGAPVATIGGQPVRIVGVIQDITARKLDELQRDTLVAELDHRIKNVLAAVQSLAAQSARKAASLEGFLKHFNGRLKSMASAHTLLTATRWRGAGLQNIAAAELGGLAPGQIRWEGPDLLLTPRATNAMSLALHELAANAVKFGALSAETGRVEVVWRRLVDGGLRLIWQESNGPRTTPPTRRGFGSTLLDKVTGRELGGEARIDFLEDGVRAVIVAGPAAFAEPATNQPEPPPIVQAPAAAGPATVERAAVRAARTRGLRVLIVEDAMLLALELEAGLQESGVVVVGCAADLAEAMRMIEQPLDAAVLDVNLNGVSVLPAAEALAKRGVPFVFATGYGDNKQGPQGFDAPVVRKPYDVTQVIAALAEATEDGANSARAPIG